MKLIGNDSILRYLDQKDFYYSLKWQDWHKNTAMVFEGISRLDSLKGWTLVSGSYLQWTLYASASIITFASKIQSSKPDDHGAE